MKKSALLIKTKRRQPARFLNVQKDLDKIMQEIAPFIKKRDFKIGSTPSEWKTVALFFREKERQPNEIS